jgi:hypothetical protein
MFSFVLANTVISIFRVNVLGVLELETYIDLAVSGEFEVKP